jgi:arylsulfatase
VFLDNGELHLEYNAMTTNRYKVKSDGPISTGASGTFDVGEDLGSPVSLDYADRAPYFSASASRRAPVNQ